MSFPSSWGRSTMVHRCEIIRNIGTEEEMPGYGPEPVWDIHLSDVPCLVHADFRSGFSGETFTPTAETVRELWRALMPKGTDIREDDILDNITDKKGEVINPNPMNVKVILRRSIYTYVFLEETR